MSFTLFTYILIFIFGVILGVTLMAALFVSKDQSNGG